MPNNPFITDADALTLMNSYDTARPDQQAEILGLLETHKQELVKREQEQELQFKRTFMDPVGFGLEPDKKTLLDTTLAKSPDPRGDSFRLMNEQFLASRYKKPIEDVGRNYEAMKSVYAKDVFGMDEANDEAFFNRVGEDYRLDDELSQKAIQAAAKDLPPLAAWAESAASVNKSEAWNKSDSSVHLDKFSRVFAGVNEQLAPFRDDVMEMEKRLKLAQSADVRAENVSGSLEARFGSVPPSAIGALDKGRVAMKEAINILLDVPADKRPLVMMALASKGQAEGENLAALQRLGRFFERGVEGLIVEGSTGIKNMLFDAGVAAIEGVLMGTEQEMQIPVEGEAQAAAPDRQEEYEQLRVQLREISQGLTPLKDVKLLGMNLGGAAQSLPMTVAAFVPYVGQALVVGQFRQEGIVKTMQENPGIDRRDAEAIANISAPIQAAAEIFTSKLLFGKLPVFERFLSSPLLTSSGLIARFGTRLSVGTGVEVLEENIQKATPLIIQEAGDALSKDVPDVDWATRFKEFKGMQLDVFATALPLVLIGAGVGSMNDYSNGVLLAKDKDALVMSGYSRSAALDIQAKVKSGDLRGAETQMRQAADTASPEERKIAAEAFRMRSEMQGKAVAAMEASGQIASVRPIAGGKWQVINPDNSAPIEFDNFDSANAARWADAKARDLRVHAAYRDIISQADRALKEGQENAFIFSPEKMTPEAAVEAGLVSAQAVEGRKKQLAALDEGKLEDQDFTRAEKEAQAEGDTDAVYTILGMNNIENREGVSRGVIRLFQGANFTDLIEEIAEVGFKRHFSTKEANRPAMLAFLRQAEGAIQAAEQAAGMEPTLLFRTKDDSQITDGDLIEAFSHLAKSYYINAVEQGKTSADWRTKNKSVPRYLRTLRAALANTEIFKWLKAMGEKLGTIYKRAAMVQEAQKAGGLDAGLEQLIRRSVGLDTQDQMEAGILQEVQGMAQEAGMSMISLDGKTAEDYNQADTETEVSFSLGKDVIAHNEALRMPRSLMERMRSEYGTTQADPIAYRPDRLYRVMDDAAWQDFQGVGYIRPNPNPTGQRAAYNRLFAAEGAFGNRYRGAYIVEIDPSKSGDWESSNDGSGYQHAAIGSIDKNSAIRIYERMADGSTRVVLDNIGDQAFLEAETSVSSMSLSKVTPAQDAEYLAAVESGDMGKAQKMVDDAAKAAGYNVGIATHSTRFDFQVFDRSYFQSGDVEGFYFAGKGDSDWSTYTGGGRTIEAYLKINNPAFIAVDKLKGTPQENREALEAQGFDGVVDDTFKGNQYIVFNSNQIKSADPVTRDTSGNIIPLSQRFNEESNSINFSLSKGDQSLEQRLAAMFDPFQKNPEQRRKLGLIAKERVAKVAREYLEETAKPGMIKRKLDEMEADRQKKLAKVTDKTPDWVKAQLSKPITEAQAKAEISQDRLLGWLRALNAAASVLPVEIRGKLLAGGSIKIASLKTNEARLRAIETLIERADTMLEKWLRKEFTDSIEKLFDRYRPTREAGQKPKGKLAPDEQILMDAAEVAIELDPVALQAEIAKAEAVASNPDATDEQQVEAERLRDILQLTGDWKNADAERMSAAYDAVRSVAEKGWAKWKLAELMKRAERAEMRESLVKDTGKTGVRGERVAMRKQGETIAGKSLKVLLNLSSFQEIMDFAFGKDSKISKYFQDKERAADNQREDAMQDLDDRVSQFFTTQAGGILKGEQLRFNMGQRTIATTEEAGEFSQLEAITAILMWQQEDGKRHMMGRMDESGKPSGKWHYNQAFVDTLNAGLNENGRALLSFLRNEYDAEYESLNALYKERHGVSLPRHQFYSPIVVAPQQAKAGEVVDPLTGSSTTSSILTPGFLRSRSFNAVAEPNFRDALQVFIAHKKMLAHWAAYYDLAVEMQSIINNREVQNAVSAKAGEQASLALRRYLDVFAQGGIRDAAAGLETVELQKRMIGRASQVALFGRLSVLLVQSTQLAAASVKMPTGAYLVRLSKLMSGNLAWGDAINSPYIQRRMKVMTPLLRQAMADLATIGKPNQIKHAAQKVGQLINGADGLFTAGTYAILLDWHKAQARKLGMTDEAEINAFANQNAERDTETVAQPTRSSTRSLAELTATHPLTRAIYSFVSEPRQKLAMLAWAAYQGANRTGAKSTAGKALSLATDPQAAKVAFLTFVVGGLGVQVIKNLWRDAKGDDDEKKWSVQRMTLAMLSSPLSSVPGFAAFTDTGGNLFSSGKRLVPALEDLVTEDQDSVQIMQDVDTVLSVAGLFSDNAAAMSAMTHIAVDAAKALKNLQDEED